MESSAPGLLAWVVIGWGALSSGLLPAATVESGAESGPSTLKVSADTLSFANQQAATASQPQTVTVTNTGSTPVTISSIAVTGGQADDFSQANTCGTAIPGHASCKINVVFKPVSVGAKSAALSLKYGDNASQRVVLDGTGVVPVFGVSAPSLTVTVAPSSPTPVPSIGLTIKNPDGAALFYNAKFSGPAVTGVDIQWNSAPTNGQLAGVAELQFDQPSLQGSGTFVSTVILTACGDSACKKPLAGSPQKVTVTYVVTGNAIPAGTFYLTQTALNVEVPSNGVAPPTTFDLTGYDLPPFAVYVTYKSKTTNVIKSMNFSGFPTTGGYASGQLAVNLAAPAQLGPGVYNDNITLSVCYDAACKKPANGSPWQIPVVYTVTASLGREFDQRIVPISAEAIAADPSGKYLYIADWEYSQTHQANLIELDPTTGATIALTVLDGYPGRMAISVDGLYAYVGVTLAATNTQEVERVNLGTMDVDLRIPFPIFGLTLGDLQVSPVDSRTLAVEYSYVDPTAGPFVDVKIFDDGVARSKFLSTASDTVYSTNIRWRQDGAQLYIRGPTSMSVSGVDSAGLTAASPILDLVYGDGFFNGGFTQLNGLLYSDGGGVLDPATQVVQGHFVFRTPQSEADGTGANLEPDSSTNRAFAAYDDPAPTGLLYTLQSFDLIRFNPLWIARFPVSITSPVRWGSNGLAFIGMNEDPTAGQFSVYLIRGSFVAP